MLRSEVYSLLYFRIMHVYDGISGVSLSLLEVAGPHVVHPVYKVNLKSMEKKISVPNPKHYPLS